MAHFGYMGTILDRLTIISAIYQILASHFSPCICSANKVSAAFVFGDSLVDVGNNFYIITIAQPTYPNGIDFVKGSPSGSGRYTNNRTVIDIIEDELGFKSYTPPYLNPQTTGDVILKGVNYASSGSGILNSTGSNFGGHISMDEQINNFAKTRKDIISRIGVAAARELLTEAFYFIAVGSNDVYFKADSSSYDDDIVYLDNLISTFRSQLTSLYNLDARKIAVTNAASFGCIPFEKDLFSTDDCVEGANELAKLYNTRLKILLPMLTASLARSTFVYMDTYAVAQDILQNYISYGFENADSACCQVLGKHGGGVPCGIFSRVCPDRSKYVFWDPYHLTESANLIAAKHILDGDLTYVSPMNIRQLANL